MLYAITNPRRIRAAQRLLETRLDKALRRSEGPYTLGFQSGNLRVNALYADHRVWFAHRLIKDSAVHRYWNGFGLADRLNVNSSNSIVVEINIPVRGVPRSVAGFFAEDLSTKSIVLLHRGKIGGGRKGVGKNDFLDWYKQDLVTVQHRNFGERADEALHIADLNSPDIARRIGNFVIAVARFKAAVREGEIAELSLTDLTRKAKAARARPRVVDHVTSTFERDTYVVEYVKRRAGGICELCNKKAPFTDASGRPYLECHHIVWLADGGHDSIRNAVALCPNCHRKMHILNRSGDVDRLSKIARRTLAAARG